VGRRSARAGSLLLCVVIASVVAGCGYEAPLDVSPVSSGEAEPRAAGWSDFGDKESDYAGTGPTVVVLGDSITHLARAELHAALDPRYRTKIGAMLGEGYGGGPLSATLEVQRGIMLEIATEYAHDRPAVAVIALGTNDAWSRALRLDAATRAMAEMIAMFSSACVVGVEASEWSDAQTYDRDEARALNARLRELADVVVRALEPTDVGADAIHPTAAGRTAFARAVAAGVEQCR
jgi:lysophospholipase L1-like esterase